MNVKSPATTILSPPPGLFNDITDGISGLVKHGNVGGLFTNVTHGVSDSAAKVTGSLSDGLGAIVMDDKHMEIRENIRRTRGAGTGEQFMAGVKGLGKSRITQSTPRELRLDLSMADASLIAS